MHSLFTTTSRQQNVYNISTQCFQTHIQYIYNKNTTTHLQHIHIISNNYTTFIQHKYNNKYTTCVQQHVYNIYSKSTTHIQQIYNMYTQCKHNKIDTTTDASHIQDVRVTHTTTLIQQIYNSICSTTPLQQHIYKTTHRF